MASAPDVGARAAGDSERHVVVVEELELSVMADAFALATLVVVAADLGEVLCVEGEDEVVEESGDVSGRLVAEFIGHEEAMLNRAGNSGDCFV